MYTPLGFDHVLEVIFDPTGPIKGVRALNKGVVYPVIGNTAEYFYVWKKLSQCCLNCPVIEQIEFSIVIDSAIEDGVVTIAFVNGKVVQRLIACGHARYVADITFHLNIEH